ncbi:MAG: hypothetical protein PUP92_12630 [Rhizonema sp. PD38]|nr:hypothetical protein [Rhizonema sp. PD38]
MEDSQRKSSKVHLKEFLLVSPKIQSTEIFKAIETAIPATSIEQAIADLLSH